MHNMWRWRLLVGQQTTSKPEYQVIHSTRERLIPLMIVCDTCNDEHPYWRRKYNYRQSACPKCGRLGVHI